MSAAEFDTNLIRLPLDYQGTPELAEIRVTVPSIVPPHVAGGDFVIGLELRDRWGFTCQSRAPTWNSRWKAQAVRRRTA